MQALYGVQKQGSVLRWECCSDLTLLNARFCAHCRHLHTSFKVALCRWLQIKQLLPFFLEIACQAFHFYDALLKTAHTLNDQSMWRSKSTWLPLYAIHLHMYISTQSYTNKCTVYVCTWSMGGSVPVLVSYCVTSVACVGKIMIIKAV